MPYEITATRRRPQTFGELKGQEFVSATLAASIESGRIAHAYLFSGPRGCGKTSAARILAKALNCEKGPSRQPCGVCRSCVEIARGASLDVLEIDGASNTSVDNVRQIKDEVLFPPNGGRYKVYIIDEVHMLSNSAFNALLKTIEEPPPYIVFIFATTELHKVPATIKSRCQQFAFRLFGVDLIKAMLGEAAAELGLRAEDEALLWIAKESGGSMRDAYTLFDQVVSFSDGNLSASLIRDKLGLVGMDALNGLFLSCVGRDVPAALDALDGILARGVTVEQCAIDSVEYFRSLLLLKHGITKTALLGAPPGAYDPAVLEALSPEQIERALAGLLDLYRNLRLSVEPRFELELAVAKLCRLPDYVSVGEIAGAVSALKRAIAGTGSPAPAQKAVDPAAPASGPAGEKKKPELPPSLSAALGSLAAAAAVEQEGAPTTAGASGTRAALMPPAPKPDPGEAEEPGAEEDGAAWPQTSPAGGGAAPDGRGEPASEAEALRSAVIDAVGRSSPLLKTGLSASLPWRIEGPKLVIPFRSGIEESVLRSSVSEIAALAAKAAGRPLKLELKIERPETGSAPGNASPSAPDAQAGAGTDPVSVVERVFRGTRVEPR